MIALIFNDSYLYTKEANKRKNEIGNTFFSLQISNDRVCIADFTIYI